MTETRGLIGVYGKMKIVELTEEQAEDIENKLDEYDEKYIGKKMEGQIRIGMEENGEICFDYCQKCWQAAMKEG